MGQVLDNYEEIARNYQEMRNKITTCIRRCDDKNLVETIKDLQILEVTRNADHVDHFILDNGLHVYRFVDKENNPLNYYISSKDMIVTRHFTNQYGTHEEKCFSGVSGFGYSKGGVKNSLPLDGIDRYITSEHIDVITPTNKDDYYPRMTIDAAISPGSRIQSMSITSKLLPNDYIGMLDIRNEEFYNRVASGNLEELIENYQPKTPQEASFKEELSETIKLIQAMQLGKEDKKGFLKKLLGRNKELDDKINAFSTVKGRR